MRRCLRLSRVLPAPIALVMGVAVSYAGTPMPQPASPQPTLPQPLAGGMPLTSPILGGGSGVITKPLVVRKGGHRAPQLSQRFGRVRHNLARYDGDPLGRPALAGVQLVAPIPHPIQPPHLTVPTPAYPFENFITYFTTPPPPVVCHRVPRDPYAPDPGLLYEKPVICEADNP